MAKIRETLETSITHFIKTNGITGVLLLFMMYSYWQCSERNASHLEAYKEVVISNTKAMQSIDDTIRYHYGLPVRPQAPRQ